MEAGGKKLAESQCVSVVMGTLKKMSYERWRFAARDAFC